MTRGADFQSLRVQQTPEETRALRGLTPLDRLSETSARRPAVVALFVALCIAVRSLAHVDVWPVLILGAAWLGVSAGSHRLLKRAVDIRRGVRLQAATVGLDMAFMSGAYLLLGGGWWVGSSGFCYLLIVGVLTLPRTLSRWTSAIAVLVFTALLGAQIAGVLRLEPLFGLPPLYETGELGAAILLAGTCALILCDVGTHTFVRLLRRTGDQHRQLLQSAPDMIFFFDTEGRFRTVNASVMTQTGYDEDELRGRRFDPFIVAEDLKRAVADFAAVVRGEQRQLRMRYRRKSGEIRWIECTATPVLDDGVAAGVLSIARDITDARRADEERAQLQIQLAQSQRMQTVGRVVSGVAHELNNPLAAILSFSELLLEEERSPADQEALRIIYDQALRSRAIVRDLLAFVRRRQERVRETLAPHALADAALRALRPQLALAGGQVELAAGGEDVHVRADRAGIEQVLTNLLLNAAHAATPGGSVRVSVERRGERCRIVVEDSGPGIPAEVMPHIFEPFFTTKGTGQGTGLGLPVSLGIVEQHGGTLTAENRAAAEGGGARFVVELPAVEVVDAAGEREEMLAVRAGDAYVSPPAGIS